jgi:hypothetical protein
LLLRGRCCCSSRFCCSYVFPLLPLLPPLLPSLLPLFPPLLTLYCFLLLLQLQDCCLPG